ncbi:MAG TPA: glucose-1-phosphate thymidylyltransferase [Chitinophagaceae bacterium]|nr:glucose-1-phosphate thymidylyltransferase [Chitinophagaceae bacterium]
MAIFLFDDIKLHQQLLPLTATKAIAALPIGIGTIQNAWELALGESTYVLTLDYLQPLYTIPEPNVAVTHTYINATYLPDSNVVTAISALRQNEVLLSTDAAEIIAYKALQPIFSLDQFLYQTVTSFTVRQIQYCWHLFQYNDWMIRTQFQLLTSNQTSATIHSSNNIIGDAAQLFIAEGAEVYASNINTTSGPVIIGKNALVMEGCNIRGPFVLGEHAVLKMGAKVYGATTVGAYSSAGGEIKNVVMSAYSNKAHDGYLGDAVIGSWCNLGAGTTNSNVKNAASVVAMYNYATQSLVPVAQKAGLIMGDYSRAAINSAFNTGTVVGICTNYFQSGLSASWIPDFSWGGTAAQLYVFDKAVADINRWMAWKQQQLSTAQIAVLQHLYQSLPYGK